MFSDSQTNLSREEKEAQTFTSENGCFKDSANMGLDVKFCCTFKRAIKILWKRSANCQDSYWSQVCMTVFVSTNYGKGCRTDQKLLNPPIGQKQCTQKRKTEQHLCLWKGCYHDHRNWKRVIKKAEICCILLKWDVTFTGSHKMHPFKGWKYWWNVWKFKVTKFFCSFPFEEGNYLAKVGEVQSEVMSGYTI